MLQRFFGAKPVAAWFNPASPRVKPGEIRPHAVSAAEALALMIADPGLIRRPLMQVGDRCEPGSIPMRSTNGSACSRVPYRLAISACRREQNNRRAAERGTARHGQVRVTPLATWRCV